MKRVIVRSINGNPLDNSVVKDAIEFISAGIADGRWGQPERKKLVKDCSKFELSNVLKIDPPDHVVIAADYTFEIQDIQSEMIEKERQKQKRLDLIRDWNALIPARKEILIRRIFEHVLKNHAVDVSDI